MFKNKLTSFVVAACSVIAVSTAYADEEKILNVYKDRKSVV